MASHVTVIATDLRRATVKVTPGTYMTDVLQEACKKLNLASDRYLLKNKQKNVDLSAAWRHTGLSPGAKLELVLKSNTPSAVSVALQLPAPESTVVPGGRLMEKFPSDLPLWKVLRQFESKAASQGKNINISARGIAQTQGATQSGSGQLYYETPVLNIMGRELASLPDFQKTLSQMGYNSGSVLIRLSFRLTDRTLFSAMEEIGQLFADAETEQKEAAAVKATPNEATPVDNSTEASSSTQPPTESATPEVPEQIPQPAQEEAPAEDAMDVDPVAPLDSLQPVGVFQAPTGTTPAAALAPLDESDYTPSIAHAQLHQARLLQSSQNKRLPSDKELEEQAQAREAKLAAVSSVTVRVRFPDNTSAQWSFGPEATGALLYKGVRSVMANEGQKFRLVLPGSQTLIKDSEGPKNLLVHDYKMTRNVLVNLSWDDNVDAAVRQQPFLKSTVAQRATAVKVPELPKVDSDQEDKGKKVQLSKPDSSDKGEGVAKKLPKWLKLGKK
ncbi:GLUT4 regulating protein TUG-domain-containing protein [Plectosphaerella plurivora]|uniref:GLUT4 regulating protein TUG-domain-containing protein n=1 Tax=Plectosphaerella plurivora TaxID=936078 RepID=A0A9P8VEE3_9PEZI|nr:GLUT4 regulating protein TUG-domain-containing protein [Plectosphaerella plurivora]